MVDLQELHRYDGVPADVMRTRARALVEAHGVNGAAARLGVSRSALSSLLAGLPVTRGTLSTVELQLLRSGAIEV